MPLISDSALERVGDGLISDTRQSQRQRRLVASGKSAASLRRQVIRNGSIATLQIHGAAHWRFQQQGRRPGTGKKMPGKLYRAIKEWVRIKGIDINPFLIARKIHREGIRVPNPYNPGGVLSEPLAPKRATGLLKLALRSDLVKSIRSQLFS
ncbi:hypothetical protein [Larkinella arboricola]